MCPDSIANTKQKPKWSELTAWTLKNDTKIEPRTRLCMGRWRVSPCSSVCSEGGTSQNVDIGGPTPDS